MKNLVGEGLMSEIRDALAKVWPSSERMREWCAKNVAGAVRLENGGVFIFKRPRIETHFCYGHGQNGVWDDEDYTRAERNAELAQTREVFFRNNIGEYLREIADFDKEYARFVSLPNYEGSDFIRCIYEDDFEFRQIFSHKEKEFREVTERDVRMLKMERGFVCRAFRKRLEAYWKRYGASKLKTWTYLVD